jgi:hypothetical protein
LASCSKKSDAKFAAAIPLYLPEEEQLEEEEEEELEEEGQEWHKEAILWEEC